jgi:hypothetical protein
MIPRLAEEANLDIRKFSATSHVVALMYGPLSGCESLNGICDAARLHEGEWRRIRGAQPPCLNTFSNANRLVSPPGRKAAGSGHPIASQNGTNWPQKHD